MATKNAGPKHNQALINMMTDKKFDEIAAYVAELVEGYKRAGQAINRLERFQFGLIKILLDKKALTYDELQAAMALLDQSNDLEVYWGVKQADEPITEVVGQESGEET
jgi:hypothetical protein